MIIGEGIGIAGPAVIFSFVAGRGDVRVLGALLRRTGVVDPGLRQRLHVRLRDARRVAAWIIGWDLILEYGVSVAAVAVGWGGNLNEFLDNAFGFALPESIATSPSDGGVFNLPAVFIVFAVMLLLARGVPRDAGRT